MNEREARESGLGVKAWVAPGATVCSALTSEGLEARRKAATCSCLDRLDNGRAPAHGAERELSMRYSLIAIAVLFAVSARANQSILTYHDAVDRSGRYIEPGLTYERGQTGRLE
jgi:hypothetical protein